MFVHCHLDFTWDRGVLTTSYFILNYRLFDNKMSCLYFKSFGLWLGILISLPAWSQNDFSLLPNTNQVFSIEHGRGISAGDFDNDGDDDLFLSAKKSKVLRNEGDFNFTDVTTLFGLNNISSEIAVWFDANNDGWLDLLVSNRIVSRFFKNNGNATFTELPYQETGLDAFYSPNSFLVGDLNGDRWLDVYTSNFRFDNQLFFNRGNLTFANQVTATGAEVNNQGMGGVLLDIDRDQDLDIYLVFDGDNPDVFFENNGQGHFSEKAKALGLNVKSQGMGVDFADFNHDGKPDFHIANLFANNLMLSQPSGVYVDKAKEAGVNDAGMAWGVTNFDYNNDGWADTYINNIYNYNQIDNKLFRNNKNDTFLDVAEGTELENRATGYGCLSADFNQDGRMDLAISNFDEGVKIFKNESNEAQFNHWLSFNLIGVQSNRFGVGGRVEVKAGGYVQDDEVTVGSGYASQNSLQIHVGVGDAVQADEVTVFWPNGLKQTFYNVDVDMRYLLVEGEPLAQFNADQYKQNLLAPQNMPLPVDTFQTNNFKYETQSVAHIWNEVLLTAIRRDFARPTIQARNLFHISLAMYDAWAAYDSKATTFILSNTVGNFTCPFLGVPKPENIDEARKEAISYAAFRLIMYRYGKSPGASISLANARKVFRVLGYDETYTSSDYSLGVPAALGNYIAEKIIEFGLADGSNEGNNYTSLFYEPFNKPMFPAEAGPKVVDDPNRWQPLTLSKSIDQNGNEVSNTPNFLSPEWGNVVPFALKEVDKSVHNRTGHDWNVYYDPGVPPLLDKISGSGTSPEYKWNFELVSAWSSHLSPADSVKIDISPASIGNIQSYPTDLTQYRAFYDFENGGDAGIGYSANPKTGSPYVQQIVYRGDYARVLAEFWADGPTSETPPGHWFTILNYVNDHPLFKKKFMGLGMELNELEWDVKSYFMLAGALHDAAITAWGIKGYYDYVRPITAIRYLASLGQSSDPNKPSYHPAGIELKPNLIELVVNGDELAGGNNENVGKIKLYCWRGPSAISNPETTDAGVGWILAENWFPYQRPTFVTPPFAGYISGHSTYSSAAAEVLTKLTGDEFFPGGLAEFEAPINKYLVFEDGPSKTIKLQWARYKDASDQCSLSRIWGGIHPPADDMPGRLIGKKIGNAAFQLATTYFDGSRITPVKEIDSDVEVYPNPVARHEKIFVDGNTSMGGTSVSLIDALGKTIAKQNMNDSGDIKFETVALSPGIYFLVIKGKNKSQTKRVLVY